MVLADCHHLIVIFSKLTFTSKRCITSSSSFTVSLSKLSDVRPRVFVL